MEILNGVIFSILDIVLPSVFLIHSQIFSKIDNVYGHVQMAPMEQYNHMDKIICVSLTAQIRHGRTLSIQIVYAQLHVHMIQIPKVLLTMIVENVFNSAQIRNLE